MTKSRVLCAATVAAIFGFASAAGAVAEAEPEASELSQEPALEEAKPPMPESAGEPGRVARSAFTTVIAEREPTDTFTTLSNDMDRVLYFTELLGLEGRTVVHRWQYGGEVVAEVPFQVGGPRWRVHSSKNLDSAWTGEWTVSVLADGEMLTSDGFSYTQAAPETPSPASQASSMEPESTEVAPEAPAPPASLE